MTGRQIRPTTVTQSEDTEESAEGFRPDTEREEFATFTLIIIKNTVVEGNVNLFNEASTVVILKRRRVFYCENQHFFVSRSGEKGKKGRTD